MSLNHIIESWRDEEYREGLDAETRALLPANPAGELELTDADLADVDGGSTETISISIVTVIASIEISFHYHCIPLPKSGADS